MPKETLLKDFDKFITTAPEITEVREFLSTALDEATKQPYDVSEWKRVGRERGYWNYFRDEMIMEVEKGLPKEDHGEEEAGTDWSNSGDVHSLGFEKGFNECLKEIKQSLSSLREGNK